MNAAVAAEAERRRIPCVRADDAAGGSARTPAVTRGAGLVVAVGSDGGPDPTRAAAVRDAVALLLETGELPLRAGRPARRLGRAGRRRAGRPGADHRPGPAPAGRGRRGRRRPAGPAGAARPARPVRRGGRRRQGAARCRADPAADQRAAGGPGPGRQAGGPAQGRRPVRARPRRRGGGRLRPGRRAGHGRARGDLGDRRSGRGRHPGHPSRRCRRLRRRLRSRRAVRRIARRAGRPAR